ncbi:MAG: hypothetical protein JSV84_12760 [Gemmatimonadota bacterium]|nr:MAG: hypothetical protein JSV84_12760 [Gemmatimonadota bacterium]
MTVTTSKPAYYRYEIVEVTVHLNYSDQHLIAPDTIYASVSRNGSVVPTIAQMVRVPCLFGGVEGLWHGYWPIPWNPVLGTYVVETEVFASDSTDTLRARAPFEIIGRPLQPLEPGMCVMTIESTIDFLKTPFPVPFDASGSEESFLTWARFLGADAIWYSVGQTMEGESGVTDQDPWYPLNVRLFPEVALKTKEAGFRFGGWIGCYFLWGENLKELDYTYSWDYWKPTGKMYRPHRVSITDEKRLSDIIGLVRMLDADPHVDYVGLDYIRTGFGGYEMVEDFVRAMSVGTPCEWHDDSVFEKRRWLALEIEVEKDSGIVEKWQWYCAHRVAQNIRTIVERSGLKKPLWVFLLGWRHGQEHGQDPIMFHDAGASWCAVMLYESNADHCREMNKSWSSYLEKGRVNLIVGESVDWELLQRSTEPPGPEEFYRRVTEAVDGLYGGAPVEGVFWHDLNRGAWGKRGPYRRLEWAVTGAASFSYVRSQNGRFPLLVSLGVPDEMLSGTTFTMTVHLENKGCSDVNDVVVEPIEMPGITFLKSGPIPVGTLRSNTETRLNCRCVFSGSENDGTHIMIATRTKWAPETHQNQYVSFAYLRRASKKILTK